VTIQTLNPPRMAFFWFRIQTFIQSRAVQVGVQARSSHAPQ